jgi:hypothetical protein
MQVLKLNIAELNMHIYLFMVLYEKDLVDTCGYTTCKINCSKCFTMLGSYAVSY